MSQPYIRSLNINQYALIAAIYSLRFSTRSILSQYLGIANNTSLYSRLQILQRHEYIAAHFQKDYRLAGREAEFYVTPKGLKALRDTERLEVTDTMLAAIYKDRTVGKDFIARQTLIARLRNQLIATYTDLQIFTSRDIQLLDYFPRPRPDLFLSMKNGDKVSRFFLEYVSASTINSQIRKRLEYHTRYHREDDWGETETPFPNILLVAENGLTAASLRRSISRELYKSDSEVVYHITVQNSLLSSTPEDHSVWSSIGEYDTPLSLDEI